jgi:acyl-CoA reductase-like NAD-dependent aldehyde dehydrogenase
MGEAPITSAAELDSAVRQAEAAFRGPWSRDAASRARALGSWADALESECDALVQLLVTETGKLVREAEFEVRSSVDALRYNAGLARYVGGRAGQLSGGTTAHLERQPVGVTAFIAPWNWPVLLLIRDLAPALAAGVTAVIKPAELTPFSTQRILELAVRADVPDGVLNLVHGGAETGQALVEHLRISAVSFTGSTGAGKAIMRTAATTLKRTVLELGGKGCSLVFADANLEAAATNFLRTAFVGAGQVCMATTRILVEAPAFDDVLDAVVEGARQMAVGDPFDPRSDMGPLITSAHRDRVLGHVDHARRTSRGVGGERLDSDPRGAYMSPAVVTQVAPESRLVQEEVFGPVVTVEAFSTEEEGLWLANGTPYGLAAGVWTQDVDRAWRVARAVDAGSVWVNGYMSSYAEMPSGGFKQSGVGRTRGVEGIEQFTELKHINWA